MASHQISLRDTVYKKLLKLKKREESFSDVIDRFIPSENDLNEILKMSGVAADQEDDMVLTVFHEAQIQVRKNFKNRFPEDLGGSE